MVFLLHSLSGIGALIAALLMVGLSIYLGRSREASQRRQWWTCLVIAAGYALMSAGFYTRSCAANHESLESAWLSWSGTIVFAVGFVLSRRKWRDERPRPTHRAV